MTEERDSLPELSFDGPSAEIGASIREQVAADLSEVAPRSLQTRIAHAAAATVIVGTLTYPSFGPAAFSGVFENVSKLAIGAGLAVLAVVVSSVAFAPQLQSVGRDTRILGVVGAIAAWSLYMFALVAEVDWASASTAGGCAARSLVGGLLAAGAFTWVWRKTDPWNPGLSGALIGTSAGVIASVCVGIVCAGGHGGHVLTGHWLAVPVLAAAGYLVSRRVLAP